MAKVLERETTGNTLERPVETKRPPIEIPPRPETPTTPRRPYVRWMGWMLAVVVIAVAGVLVAIQGEDAVVGDDGSFEANELARMLSLVPEIDPTLEANGFEARVGALTQPIPDVSFESNELARMLALAPTGDVSFEANELARMQGLAPETSDGSFEANELARMLALEPEG